MAGTKLRFYLVSTGDEPALIIASRHSSQPQQDQRSGAAGQTGLLCILEVEGEGRFREVVNEIQVAGASIERDKALDH